MKSQRPEGRSRCVRVRSSSSKIFGSPEPGRRRRRSGFNPGVISRGKRRSEASQGVRRGVSGDPGRVQSSHPVCNWSVDE